MKKKKGLAILLIAISSVSLTGCSNNNSFYFDFTKFIIEEDKSDKTQNTSVKLEGIDLANDVILENDILNLNNIINTIFTNLSEKDYYYKTFNNQADYFDKVSYLLSDEFYSYLSEGNESAIKKAIDNIYYNSNTSLKSTNIIAIEKTLNDISCYIEVVSINDDVLFQSEIIKVTFDNFLKIKSDETISTITTKSNTIRPLNKDSLLQFDHNGFLESLTDLLNKLNNPDLYKDISFDNSNTSNLILENAISNINVSEDSKNDLINLFNDCKGSLNNYSIESYIIDDYKALANTTYIVSFPVDNEIKKYEFTYSRISKKIIEVCEVY